MKKKTKLKRFIRSQEKRIDGRILNVLMPWIMSFVVVHLFAWGFHTLWSDHSIWLTLGTAFTAAVLVPMVHSMNSDKGSGVDEKGKRGRRKANFGRWHGTVTISIVILWLYMASLIGPWTSPALDIGILLGSVMSISWNIRTHIRNNGEGISTIGDKKWLEVSEDLGLSGTKWRRLPSNNSKIIGIIGGKPGRHTFEDIKAKRDKLASFFRVDSNSVKILRTKDSSQARVEVVIKDHLDNDVVYARSEFAGKSITEGPIRLGMYQDGRLAELNLYDKTGARHLLISGMTGSGKSAGARAIIADLFDRTDTSVIAIDTVKGLQTVRPAIDGLSLFVSNRGEAMTTISKLTRVINARANALGEAGFDAWNKEAYEKLGMKFLVILIEEAPAIIRDDSTFVRLVEQGRSAGVSVIISLQRASHTSIPTDARAQFGIAICFGVKEARDARFILNPDLVDRGADPSAWAQRYPGRAYMQAPEIDEDQEIVPLKFMEIPVDMLEKIAKESTPSFDTITGEILDVKAEPAPTRDYEEKINIDSVEIPDVSATVHFSAPANLNKRISAEKARAMLDDEIKSLKNFTPKDLYKVMKEANRSRPWIQGELKRRLEEGTLFINDEGIYSAN